MGDIRKGPSSVASSEVPETASLAVALLHDVAAAVNNTAHPWETSYMGDMASLASSDAYPDDA